MKVYSFHIVNIYILSTFNLIAVKIMSSRVTMLENVSKSFKFQCKYIIYFSLIDNENFEFFFSICIKSSKSHFK